MTPASSQSLDVAQRLLTLEASQAPTSAGGGVRAVNAENAARVCEKLRTILTAFAGAAGFRSLLTRALTLARAQEPSLAGVVVLEDGSLTGLEKLRGASRTVEPGYGGEGEGGQVLVAQLLDLLILFIGEPMTHQLVYTAWPEASPATPRSRTKDSP